jgi:predicted transcriptional regulator
MAKRGKLEIIKDVLSIIKSHGSIKITPLLRRSNMSSERFRDYYSDLLKKRFVKEVSQRGSKFISITDRGLRFLEKYKTIVDFIDEFEL